MDNPYQQDGKWFWFDETDMENGPYDTKRLAEWELDWYVFTCLGTRNSVTTLDFLKYAMAHPEERFWQALRNWSGYSKVYALPDFDKGNIGLLDTFSWEGKRHNE